MANQLILDYLAKYSQQYPLDALKRKIISSGYKEEEVNEAIDALGLSKISKQEESPVGPEEIKPEEKSEEKPSEEFGDAYIYHSYDKKTLGFRWIKTGGFFGIVFILFGLLFSLFYIFNLSSIFGDSSSVIVVSLSFGMIVTSLFFYFGFYKFGENAEFKKIRFCSFVIFLGIIVLSLVFLISIFLTWYQASSMQGFSIQNLIKGELTTIGSIIYIILLLISFGIFIFQLILSLELVKLKEQFKFAGAGGMINIIFVIILLVFGISSFFELDKIYPKIIFIGVCIFGLLNFLFESLILLQGSRKFE